MTLEKVKEQICKVIEFYFIGAKVLWAELANTKPPLPYVTLKVGHLDRTAFPIEEETEERERSYQCDTVLEVNLYTKGKSMITEEKVTGSYANTALSDLTSFTNFLESEEITDKLAKDGIASSLMPQERDLGFLENETAYRYRVMAEYAVSFVIQADGAYGIGGMEIPNPSGGGTKEMAETPIEAIKEVEIETERREENEK